MTTNRTLAYSLVALLLTVWAGFGAVNAFAGGHEATETMTMKAAPATPKRATKRKVTMPPDAPRYKCEDGECTCKGVLDCKALLDSGFCKDKTFWEGEDPSEGGCG